MPRKKNQKAKKAPKKSTPTKAVLAQVRSTNTSINYSHERKNSFEVKSFRHTRHGEGIMVSGTSYVGIVQTTIGVIPADVYVCFTSVAGTNYLMINPHVMAGTDSRLARMANQYARYRFTRLRLRYVPACPTTVDNSLSLAYCQDPIKYKSSTWNTADGYRRIVEMRPSLNTAPWREAAMDCTPALDKDWIGYVDVDDSTDAGIRQSTQGVVVGSWLGKYTVGVNALTTRGTIEVDYVVEFYDPVNYQDLALSDETQTKPPPETLKLTGAEGEGGGERKVKCGCKVPG